MLSIQKKMRILTASSPIEEHKRAAMHFEEAAKNHHEAAFHLLESEFEKSILCTARAQGHEAIAQRAQQNVLKHYAMSQLSF